MDRREFLKVGAASLAAGYLSKGMSAAIEGKRSAFEMPKRRLGRTNLEVSLVGFSGCRLISRPGPPLSQETANRMVSKAPMFGTDSQQFYRRVLSFSLAQDVASVLVGTQSVAEVEMSAEAALAYHGLAKEEKETTGFGAEREAKGFCRLCNMCLPCPAGIDIPGVLRTEINARLYGLRKWAEKEYDRRNFNAERCTKCGRCTERCPHGVPAQALVLQAAKDLG